jgi:alkylation response protein AidB-like acyl-CoA dehydrogenase
VAAGPGPAAGLLDGEKWFVTFGSVAAVIVVMATAVDRTPGRRDPPPGASVTHAVRRPADAPGVEIVDDPPFSHSFPHGHPVIRFTDVELADADVLAGSAAGTSCSAAGSPRSGSGSRPAAAGRCSACSRTASTGRSDAGRAAPG